MNKLLKILVFILLTNVANGQTHQKITGYGFQWMRGIFDSSLQIPTGSGTPSGYASLKSVVKNKAALYYDSLSKKLYVFSPKDATWYEANGSTTLPWDSITGKPTNFSTTYAISNDVKDSILARLRLIDTSGMLSPYRRTSTLIQQSEVNGLSTSLGAKLNTGDTSSMLSGYVRNGTVVKYSDTASVLSGYARNGNVVKYTDINVNNGVAGLDAGGKVPFSLLPAALMIYKGTWNAATNTPTLSDGTGVTGWIYIVSTGGTVNTGSGNITYSAGDYAIYNGTAWERSVGTNNVASVNGQQGVVTLTTSNIGEGTNLYYTDARARAALSFAAGSGAYNSTTGVITIPTNNNQLTNGAGYITSSALTPYLLLAGGTMSGSINMGTNSISNVNNFSAINLTGTGTANLPFATVIEAGNAGAGGNYDIFVKANSNNVVKLRTKAELISDLGLLTGNQTITLSGDITGSGTTAITTAIGAGKVTNTMLAGSIDYAKMNAATVPTWNQNTTGNAATATTATNWAAYSQGAISGGSIGFLMSYNGVGWGYSDQTAIRTFLNLGSYAYRSSGLAELTGATFTGALNGTTGNFTTFVNAGSGVENASIGAGSLGFYNASSSNKFIKLSDDANTIDAVGFRKSSSIATVWFPNGNVGIGTATPDILGGGSSVRVLTVLGSSGSQRGRIEVGTISSGTTDVLGGIVFVNNTTYMGAIDAILDGASNSSKMEFRTVNAGTPVVFLSADKTGAANFSSSVTAGGDIRSNGIYRDYQGEALLQTSGSNTIIGTSGAGTGRSVSVFAGNAERLTISTSGVTTVSASTASTSTSTGALVVAGGVGVGGAVYAGGDVVAYSTSDRRLKDNIKPIENALYKVGQLSGNEFDWNSKQETYHGHDYGVVAQEVEKVLPYAVALRANGFYGVKYERIIPLLIEAIKELKQEINLLKNK